MPIKLVPPRKGRSANWRIRGTYLGIYVDESTGCDRRAAAEKVIRRREREIEGGLDPRRPRKTFDDAAAEYLKSCPDSEETRIDRILDEIGDLPLDEIDDQEIRRIAAKLHPPGPSERPSPKNATVNREIVSPISAVCHAAGLERRFRRYKESSGRVRFDEPEAIMAFLDALPETVVTEKGKFKGQVRHPRAYAFFLFSCNARRGDGITLDWADVSLNETQAMLWDTKNGEPRVVHLNEIMVVTLANLPHRRGSVFGYRRPERVNEDWRDARGKCIKDYPLLADLTPHGARHVFATWQRRAGTDLKKLMQVGGWKDIKSVLRYEHVPQEEIKQALENSPLNKPTGGKSVESESSG